MFIIDKNELPENWINANIETVCTNPQYGYTTKAAQNGDIKLLRTTDITSGSINWQSVPFCSKNPDDPEKYLLKDGDVVISRAGSVGFSYLIEKPIQAVFASYLIRFRPVVINKKYFKYFLNSPFYWLSISEKKMGIALANVNANKLKTINIPITSLPEQHQIVSKLEELFSELDKGIENLEKAKAQLKTYRQSVLKQAFEGKLTEDWRAKHQPESAETLLAQIEGERENHYQKQLEEWKKACEQAKAEGKKKPTKPKKPKKLPPLTEAELAELPELPEGWCYTNLALLGELERGKSKHRPRNDKKLFGGKYPFVQTGEVKAVNKYISKYQNTYNDIGLSQSKYWPKGTLCITIAANIAEAAFLGFDACFPDSIVGFTPFDKFIYSDFIFYFLKANQKMIETFAPATAQKNINLKTLENLIIPYCDLSEQIDIVDEIESRLSVCDKLEQTIDESLQKAESLRQSILKKAFEGELTRKWRETHPELVSGENSAQKLLERIQAEKAAAKTGNGNKKRQSKKAGKK